MGLFDKFFNRQSGDNKDDQGGDRPQKHVPTGGHNTPENAIYQQEFSHLCALFNDLPHHLKSLLFGDDFFLLHAGVYGLIERPFHVNFKSLSVETMIQLKNALAPYGLDVLQGQAKLIVYRKEFYTPISSDIATLERISNTVSSGFISEALAEENRMLYSLYKKDPQYPRLFNNVFGEGYLAFLHEQSWYKLQKSFIFQTRAAAVHLGHALEGKEQVDLTPLHFSCLILNTNGEKFNGISIVLRDHLGNDLPFATGINHSFIALLDPHPTAVAARQHMGTTGSTLLSKSLIHFATLLPASVSQTLSTLTPDQIHLMTLSKIVSYTDAIIGTPSQEGVVTLSLKHGETIQIPLLIAIVLHQSFGCTLYKATEIEHVREEFPREERVDQTHLSHLLYAEGLLQVSLQNESYERAVFYRNSIKTYIQSLSPTGRQEYLEKTTFPRESELYRFILSTIESANSKT